MAKDEQKSDPVPETPEPQAPPTPEQRAQACTAALPEFLTKYGCYIHTYLQSKQVGPEPVSEALISARFAVLPNPE